MHKNRLEIRMAGSGGQGLILASIVLGEAATLSGLMAAQSQSYGPEARGGASRAEVVISRKAINYPLVKAADLFLALTAEACEKYRYLVKENGIIILDEDIAEKLHISLVYRLPILETARREVGREIAANMISLGIVNALGPNINTNLLEESICKRTPAKYLESNINAFRLGNSMIK